MSDDLKPGRPVSGYRPQSDTNIALVNEFKADEERLLRKLDTLAIGYLHRCQNAPRIDLDKRWLAIARTGIEQSFMALNRAVFQPGRVKLPEDE